MAGTGNPLRLRSGGPVVPAIHAFFRTKDVDARQPQTSLRSLRKLGCVAGHDGGKQSLHTRAFHRLGEGALGEHALEMKLRRRSCENIVDRFEIIGQRSASRLADRR
jgi:hypothetical protein